MNTTASLLLTERKIASNGVFGMIFVLATEAMFFAGLISAYVVNRANVMTWPPEGQPRLPVAFTAANSCFLIASAFTLFFFRKRFVTGSAQGKSSRTLLLVTIILGALFLSIQGSEWIKLIGFGLTTHSSIYGAFFYTLIGLHALHVLVGLMILAYLYLSLPSAKSFEIAGNRIVVCGMYWYFVVVIWPILYYLVYLM